MIDPSHRLPVTTVQAVHNNDSGTVARFFQEVVRGGFSVARSDSQWRFVAFLEPGVTRRIFCRGCQFAGNIHGSRV